MLRCSTRPWALLLTGCWLVLGTLPTAGRAATVQDFEALALFADPSLEALLPFSFGTAAVVDETTLGALVGFSVPGDVPAGSLASSGSQGLVNLFAPVLSVGFAQATHQVSLSLVSLRGEDLQVEALDALDQVIASFTGLPPVGASGFPQAQIQLAASGIVGLRVQAGSEATSFFLDDLAVVPEPRLALLLAVVVFALGGRSLRRPGAAVVGSLLLLSCGPVPVLITSPAEGALLLAPQVTAQVQLVPPLAIGDTLEATLLAGLDFTDATPQLLDLSPDLQVDPSGATAQLVLQGLPPGRSTISIKRYAPGGGPAVGFDTVTVDRGGFFPGALGPYGAGVLTDQVTVPDLNGQPRTLDLFVWYPTDTQGPITPLLGATPGAPVATGAAELPVLLFSHGSCGIPNQSTLLTAELARAGWVTLAMSHPPNVLGPGCADPVSLFIAFTERPYDVSRALDWLLAENTDPGSALFGLVDATRVGLSGHSFGGMTSLIAPGLDARIRATMPLAPEYSSVEDLVDAGLPLPIPSLVQGGSLDATTPFLEDQAPLFPLMLAPRFLVEILQGDHGTFSDFCSGTACQPDLVRQYGFGFLGRYVAADRRWASLLEESPGTILTADP